VDRDTLVEVFRAEEEELIWFYMPGMNGSQQPWATAKKTNRSSENISCSFKTKNLSSSTTFLLRGVVKTVLSGDRISVRFDRTRFNIKLWGIRSPSSDSKYFEPAKDHLSKLCKGKDVLVYCQRANSDGELLGVVEVGDQDINSKMVADGFAVSEPKETGLSHSLVEEKAFKGRRGLWKELDWQKLNGRYLQSF
jgi:endonuclease YncB( thermonuclease family)